MKFPSLKSGKTTCMQVNALQGGCNLRDGMRHVGDTQLAEVTNMWWKNGALRTRPFFAHGEEKLAVNRDEDRGTWRFLKEDTVKNGKVGRRYIRYTSNQRMQVGVLTYDGTFIAEGLEYFMHNGAPMSVVEYPYSETEDVIVFAGGGIYAQNQEYGWRDIKDEAYVPCVSIDGQGEADFSTPPSHTGTPYEGFNLLNNNFSAKFTTTETGAVFHLPYKDLSTYDPVKISVTDIFGETTEYVIPANATTCTTSEDAVKPYVDHKKGIVYFVNKDGAYTALAPGVKNNMTITAGKGRTDEQRLLLASATIFAWYGGTDAGCDSRLFISGSKYAPNRIYWSGKGQPLYFPEDNYMAVGSVQQAVTAFGKQDGQLVIFKEQEIYSLGQLVADVSEDVVDGRLTATVTKTSEYFPLTQLSAHIGCAAPNTLVTCGDCLCWADGKGDVYALVEDTTGYKVRALSSLVASRLRAVPDEAWETASAALYDGHYLLYADGTIYVLRVDEKAFKQYAGQQLNWYIWELPKDTSLLCMYGNGYSVTAMYKTYAYDEKSQTELVCYTPLCLCESVQSADKTALEDPCQMPSSFSTKEYPCGEVLSRKRVLCVYLGLETAAETKARFTYCQDGSERQETREIQGETAGETVLSPNLARTRRFGLKMEATGPVAVDSLSFSYR